MKKARWLLLLTGLLLFSCGSPTATDPVPNIEHLELVKVEWKVAQDTLAKASDIRDRAYKVSWSEFGWIAHVGPWSCTLYGKQYFCNGEFTPENIIHWNVLTPKVIRHEAGHAILKKLNHPCEKWVQITETESPEEGATVVIHGYYDRDDAYDLCVAWIKHNWGGGQ